MKFTSFVGDFNCRQSKQENKEREYQVAIAPLEIEYFDGNDLVERATKRAIHRSANPLPNLLVQHIAIRPDGVLPPIHGRRRLLHAKLPRAMPPRRRTRERSRDPPRTAPCRHPQHHKNTTINQAKPPTMPSISIPIKRRGNEIITGQMRIHGHGEEARNPADHRSVFQNPKNNGGYGDEKGMGRRR